MYVLSWRTVYALVRALFLCLFPSLLRNSGNKHQNSLLVSAQTVRLLSPYIFLYVYNYLLLFLFWWWCWDHFLNIGPWNGILLLLVCWWYCKHFKILTQYPWNIIHLIKWFYVDASMLLWPSQYLIDFHGILYISMWIYCWCVDHIPYIYMYIILYKCLWRIIYECMVLLLLYFIYTYDNKLGQHFFRLYGYVAFGWSSADLLSIGAEKITPVKFTSKG